jgi:hypothetical protein
MDPVSTGTTADAADAVAARATDSVGAAAAANRNGGATAHANGAASGRAPSPSFGGNGNGAPRPAAPTDPLSAFTQGLVQAAADAAMLLGGAPAASGRPARPLIPNIDFAALGAQLLGEAAPNDTVADNLVTDDGPPRLFSPYLPELRAAAPDTLPVMFYLPGIDGTGLAAYQQFPRLMAHFDLRCLVISPSDRSPFEELLANVEVGGRTDTNTHTLSLLATPPCSWIDQPSPCC